MYVLEGQLQDALRAHICCAALCYGHTASVCARERFANTAVCVYATSRLCACTCFVVCVLRPPGWLHMQRSGVMYPLLGGQAHQQCEGFELCLSAGVCI